MNYNNVQARQYPSILKRIYSVWFRHFRVYSKNLISNGLPPFLEPLFFIAAFSLGFSSFIPVLQGMPYLLFLGSGILITSACFTAVFECTFGTHSRLEFEKIYDGMLGSPLKVKDLFIGEVLFTATKGFFFTTAVLIILLSFQIIQSPLSLLTPLVGFLTGALFGALSLVVTSFVKNLNHFNFYITGFITPLFFCSGAMFPLEHFPKSVQYIVETLPLVHSVRLSRAFCREVFSILHVFDLVYLVIVTVVLTFFAVKRLEKRLID